MDQQDYPLAVFIFSGKRKSGKDYTVEFIQNKIGVAACEIIRLSEPIKRCYALDNNLDFQELMSDSPYKEQHRLKMLQWSERLRESDYGYFCRAAIQSATPKPIWIVSDARRRTDLNWFSENYPERTKTVRIKCADDVRTSRGWQFETSIDDAATECDLDDIKQWDFVITNDNDHVYQKELNTLLENINKILH